MSTLPDPCGRAAATRQKLARFPAAVRIFVADAAINIAMKQIAAAFVRYKPEAGRRAGGIAADAEVGRVESYDDAGAREREDHRKAQRAKYCRAWRLLLITNLGLAVLALRHRLDPRELVRRAWGATSGLSRGGQTVGAMGGLILSGWMALIGFFSGTTAVWWVAVSLFLLLGAVILLAHE